MKNSISFIKVIPTIVIQLSWLISYSFASGQDSQVGVTILPRCVSDLKPFNHKHLKIASESFAKDVAEIQEALESSQESAIVEDQTSDQTVVATKVAEDLIKSNSSEESRTIFYSLEGINSEESQYDWDNLSFNLKQGVRVVLVDRAKSLSIVLVKNESLQPKNTQRTVEEILLELGLESEIYKYLNFNSEILSNLEQDSRALNHFFQSSPGGVRAKNFVKVVQQFRAILDKTQEFSQEEFIAKEFQELKEVLQDKLRNLKSNLQKSILEIKRSIIKLQSNQSTSITLRLKMQNRLVATDLIGLLSAGYLAVINENQYKFRVEHIEKNKDVDLEVMITIEGDGAYDLFIGEIGRHRFRYDQKRRRLEGDVIVTAVKSFQEIKAGSDYLVRTYDQINNVVLDQLTESRISFSEWDQKSGVASSLLNERQWIVVFERIKESNTEKGIN